MSGIVSNAGKLINPIQSTIGDSVGQLLGGGTGGKIGSLLGGDVGQLNGALSGLLNPTPVGQPSAQWQYYPSLYQNGFPTAWGNMTQISTPNPLARVQWYNPQQIGTMMSQGGMGPSALGANDFIARLSQLTGRR